MSAICSVPRPTRRGSVFLFLFAAMGAVVLPIANASSIPADNPLVRVEGRSVTTARHGVRLGYPGVALHLTVHGPNLAFRTDASAEEVDFDVMLDGVLQQRVRLPRGEAETVLFSGASDTDHRVEIVHCTESSNGYCEVATFTTAGAFLPPTPAPGRRLLLIGDSFTCGAATECRPGLPINPSKARRENCHLSYGWLLARRLDAQVHIIGYAGRGLMRDWQGLKEPRSAPEFYEFTLADDSTTPWAHHSYEPDIIGVCLGNDFDSGVPDEQDYVQTYVEFVRKLRRDAPRARIFLLLSPVVKDEPGTVPRRTVLRSYQEAVVRHLGDPGVRIVDIGTYPGVPGDWHPDGTAHEAVANILEPLFRHALE